MGQSGRVLFAIQCRLYLAMIVIKLDIQCQNLSVWLFLKNSFIWLNFSSCATADQELSGSCSIWRGQACLSATTPTQPGSLTSAPRFSFIGLSGVLSLLSVWPHLPFFLDLVTLVLKSQPHWQHVFVLGQYICVYELKQLKCLGSQRTLLWDPSCLTKTWKGTTFYWATVITELPCN